MFGQGNGDIVLDDVGCDGTETRLEDCPKAQMPAECTHTQDAGVSCESEWARSYVTLCIVTACRWQQLYYVQHTLDCA